ncbi:hypothetical protein RB3133 [Rhodopirellula baltica SH 1]|uniref:Uncharacterized protein n=1 Tax=Rhodopirellula baltica (strain DSM 10527 / NCIMB 13988 / SH1) TaxID=243090 RepID=Q7UUR1_RHOBA|nr:hypothetical protein RB3133 [Rhodopirellula baltica SH 1]
MRAKQNQTFTTNGIDHVVATDDQPLQKAKRGDSRASNGSAFTVGDALSLERRWLDGNTVNTPWVNPSRHFQSALRALQYCRRWLSVAANIGSGWRCPASAVKSVGSVSSFDLRFASQTSFTSVQVSFRETNDQCLRHHSSTSSGIGVRALSITSVGLRCGTTAITESRRLVFHCQQ